MRAMVATIFMERPFLPAAIQAEEYLPFSDARRK
jgi:hypothetical protein